MKKATVYKAGLLILLLWVLARVIPIPSLTDEPQSRVLFSNTNDLLRVGLSADDKYRVQVPLSKIAKPLVSATMLYEDQYFPAHWGVNTWSLIRGVWRTMWHPNRPVGGSTITMQLVRLRYRLSTRSVLGKAQQVLLSLLFELRFSKEQILEAYLNDAPYGANIEGIEAASLIYFRKSAADLSMAEAVTLAVIPQSPSVRWKVRGRKSLDSARAMLAAKVSKQLGKQIIPRDFSGSVGDIPAGVPHLVSRVARLTGAPKIKTTINAEVQITTERVLGEALSRYADYGITNGTILVAEVPTMEVRAYVGSAGYVDEKINGYVNGLSAKRSPGSLLKPFVYALGIDQGKIIPETMVSDVPVQISSYAPKNFERNFLGPLPASEALVRSRNIPALEVFRQLKKDSLHALLHSAGVQKLRSGDYYGLGMVLGGIGISSEEIAQLFGMLGNYGRYVPLQFLQGSLSGRPPTQLISPEAAFLTQEMLTLNPSPTRSSLKIPWKTGTSFGSRDAWAAGVVGRFVVVVWLGNFDGKPNSNLVGRDMAGPVLFALAERLFGKVAPSSLPTPQDLNVKKVEVCALSGALPNSSCPHKKQSWYIPGVSPTTPCALHRKFLINPDTGLRRCAWATEGEERVFEVWDSPLLALFAKAGLRRNIAPPYEPTCLAQQGVENNIRIVTPEKEVEYLLEESRPLELPLRASAPGDARQLSWFVDNDLIGQVAPGEVLYWRGKIGTHVIRASDDLGRSTWLEIKVTNASAN